MNKLKLALAGLVLGAASLFCAYQLPQKPRQCNLWEIASQNATEEIKFFSEKDPKFNSEIEEGINSQARITFGEDAVIIDRTSLKGKKISLIEDSNSLEDYIASAQQRTREFKEWIENKGLKYPVVKFNVPKSVEEINYRAYEEGKFTFDIVDNFIDYFLCTVFAEKNHRTRYCNINITANPSGEIEWKISRRTDSSEIKLHKYFCLLRARDQLDVIAAEIGEPLHYSFAQYTFKSFSDMLTEEGNNVSDEREQEIQEEMMKNDEGIVHALAFFYLRDVKRQDILPLFQSHGIQLYEKLRTALDIVNRISPEKSIEEYKRDPREFYSN